MRSMVAAFRNAPASVARYYTDDARIIGGGMSAIGRQQVDAYWAQATGFAGWALDVLAAGGEPNTPWVIGRSTLRSQSGRDMITEFVGVLRRGTDGQLRFYIDRYASAR
jgi:ketosteroid isomerase-like protein